MPKRKEAEEFAELEAKECWHAYSLQSLNPAKFSQVVAKILAGNYGLVNNKFDKRVSAKTW
jgi:hypothetical protein